MGEIKSAYEIALEKVDEMEEEKFSQSSSLEVRENIKPLLASFYKGKIDSDELWQELQGEDSEILREAQVLIAESLGLRTSEEDLKKRKKGILAIENLKERQNSSMLEQILNKIGSLQEKYSRERKQMEERIKQQRQNSQMKMKPVRTEDGRTVMKMEADMDEEQKRQFNESLSRLEQRSSEMMDGLLAELKEAF
ncbi:MAG: hypothetical protein ACOCQC_03590 [Halanaerobiaceae bacterium]